MSAADIIVIIALAAAVAAALIFMIIRRRNGKSCSCNCENCPSPCKPGAPVVSSRTSRRIKR